MDKKIEIETITDELEKSELDASIDVDEGDEDEVAIELTKNGKPKKPRDPNIQDVRLPVDIDVAKDAKKMGKMIRGGRVALFLKYIREGLQRDIIAEQAILNAKGFVPTSALLVNTLASANSSTQATTSNSGQDTEDEIAG